jgi:energy-coupling factor transporter transmembrane protein EcfT
MSEFTSWEAVKASAPLIVAFFVEFTKGVGFVKKMPTQLWSVIVSLVVLMLVQVFSGEMTASLITLTAFNAVNLSLTANGTHAAVTRVKGAAGAEVKGDGGAPP